jgi:hypothetical protein
MDQSQFVAELAKLRPSSTFLTISGYRNDASEIADYSVAFHISYENALKRSIKTLAEMELTTDLEKQARFELLDSFARSLAKGSASPELEERDPTYSYFKDDDGNPIKGIKIHNASGELYMYGLMVHKKVRLPGIYPSKNKQPLTVAKDKLRFLCPVGRFRQFRINPSQVDHISVENLNLLPPE